MDIDGNKILELASEAQDLSDGLNNTNLLDVVHMNENAHSRILRLIMQYVKDHRCPFYESFLRINKIACILPEGFSAERPTFVNEQDRIDLLIEGKGYAIIIENKVYDAVDQDRQLERYLDSCIGRGFPIDRLYALYLTLDGSKEGSSYSLTEKAKEVLGVTNESTGRFVEINFHDDILPWLREAITLCKGEDDACIKAALIQYADYVSEMYGETENSFKYKIAITELLAKNDIRTIASFTEHIDAANRLSTELIQRRDKKCEFIAMRFISSPLKEYCEKRGISLLYEKYSFSHVSIRMSLHGKERSFFCLDTENDGRIFYGISNFNVADKETLSEEALLRFKNAGYTDNDWWPAWRHLDSSSRRFERPASVDFWEISVMDKSFANFVIDAYEEVEKILNL